MKKIAPFVLFLLILLLAACGGGPEPTAEPTDTPEDVPEPQGIELTRVSVDQITNITWQWVSTVEDMPASQSVVPDPENYTLVFLPDETFQAKADCNLAAGGYLVEGDALTFTPGPMTLAECGPDSQYDFYLLQLGQTGSFGMLDDYLYLVSQDGNVRMQFENAGPAEAMQADLEPATLEEIVDITWQWVAQTEEVPAFQSVVPDPDKYVLIFRQDESYSARADCNFNLGSFSVDGTDINIIPGPATLAYCGEESLSEIYLLLLSQVGSFGTQDGELVLVSQDGNSRMRFANAGPAPEPEPTPELEPDDPVAVLGDPDGLETFDTKRNWGTFDNQCFKTEITNGQFVMTAKGQEGTYCWEISWPQIDNFYIETLVNMPEACNSQDRFGLLLRAPDNNRGYLYGLDCAGNYSLMLWDGRQTIVLVEPAQSEAITSEAGEKNRMGIALSGGNFYLYANGEYLDEAEDFTFTDPGKIGYFVRAATTSPFTVIYDELSIWALDDTFYPPQRTSPPRFPEISLPPPPESGFTGTAKVNVNIRTGPGMQFKVIGAALQGQSGEVLGVSPDGYWYNVRLPEGLTAYETGWVAKDYVNLSPGDAVLPVVTPPFLPQTIAVDPPAPNAPQIFTLERANVRIGPGIEYPMIGLTSVNVSAEVIGKDESGEWWQIKLPERYVEGGAGWVNSISVETRNVNDVPIIPSSEIPPVPPDARPTAPGQGAAAAKALETISVYSRPDTNSASYGKAPAGAIMAITGKTEDGKWWRISLPTEIASSGFGWVEAGFVEASKTDNVPVIQNP